ncbi:polymorphic toxin-type HINT domain-containing protein, partial [Streptomyces koyangensis]
AAKRAAAKRAAAAARQRAQRAAAKRAQAARAAARKARANKAPKAKAKPKSQPKPKSKPSQKSKPTQRKTNKVKEEAREQAKDAVGEQAEQAVQEPTSCNSFTPGTKVLMADGSKKAIENIKTGDTVLATDPATGETKAQPVAATIIGTGDKTLVTVTVRMDGDRAPETALFLPTRDKSVALDTSQLHPADDGAPGAKTGAIVATDGHPFWVPELDKWLDADQLKPGQRLYTSAGTWAQITDISIASRHATVHNLTVTDTHTYYVLAATNSVLVHNTNDEACPVTRSVISETENGTGSIVGKQTVNADQAVNAGLEFVGPGYRELGVNRGVFRSADGLRQFRIDGDSLDGNHWPHFPHVHFQIFARPKDKKSRVNNHVPLIE